MHEPIDPYRVWVPWRDFWSFKTTLWGRAITHYLVWALETVAIAPKGSMGVSGFLKKGADGPRRGRQGGHLHRHVLHQGCQAQVNDAERE